MGVIRGRNATVFINDTPIVSTVESFMVDIDDPIISGPVFVNISTPIITTPMEFMVRFTSSQFWRLIRYAGIHHNWKQERHRWFRSVALHTALGHRRKGSNGWK